MDGRDHQNQPDSGNGRPRFQLDLIPDRERVIIAPAGEVDLATAPQLLRSIEELLERGFEHVVIDLRRVEFIGSQGLRALTSAKDRAQELGAAVTVIVGNGVTHRVLEISELLPNFDTTG